MNTAGQLGSTDIDVFALAVRDNESRRLIGEAITAYRGGALRSAIVSAWIAVAYDVIAKARELANQGEAAPQAFVEELDDAIEADDKRKLQTIESELITKADSDLQLLAPHELDALVRLQRDRHLCAHPAFVVEDELYQPTPELVRAHIVHALQYLLVHAPLQGKSAIARFDADLLSPSFPATPEEISTFLRTRYLDRAKAVLVVNLIKAIISAPFGVESAKYAGKIRTLALTLREIANAKTQIYDSIVPGYVAQKFDSVTDDVILRICPFLANDPRIWDWLKESEHTRIRRLLETGDVETLKSCCAFDAIATDPVSGVLLDRFDKFPDAVQISIILEHPSKELVSKGVEIYSQAATFRHAEHLGQSVIIPLAEFFDSRDVEAVLTAASENEQIWLANGTSAILGQLFDQTTSLLSESRPHWEEFVRGQIEQMDGDASEYYSYPSIQRRLERSGDSS
ncbi:MAG: hypothetical protein OXR72_04210 [Gemmatimonadota bacterium]|nr:hypothetical protein [Gemmatimonadota bacterium]